MTKMKQNNQIVLGLPITIPKVPNYLQVDDCDVPFSIGQFSDDELRAIGHAWTKKLIKRAEEIRNEK